MNIEKQAVSGSVYVVDDEESVRTALTRSLEKRGYNVQSFDSADAFLNGFIAGEPSALVLDVRMPGMTGLELQDVLVDKYPYLPIIFITGHGDIPMSVRAIKDGAFQFLEKPYRVEALQEFIDQALEKSADLLAQETHVHELQQRLDKLTAREIDVMLLLVGGAANYSNKEIANQLNISHRTVDDHRARIMAKMQARSLSELVDMAKVCGVYQAE